jgi:tRNA(Ile)-lysidine synthase
METRSSQRIPPPPKRESGVVQRVRASLANWADPVTKPHILIGCSGGRDSVAMASVLSALVRTGTITAGIVHVDHQQRSTSGLAAEGTERIAETLGLPFHLVTLDTELIGQHEGVGREESLRRERYLAMSRVARRTQADAIAVAHHERDQAETVLLHLIRGAGLHGATGMREWTTIDVPWWPSEDYPRALTIWRPFLRESWDDIEEVASAARLPIFVDDSNEDRRFRRNAIRHDVLPILEQISSGAATNIARFAELAGEDDDLLDAMARDRLHVQPDGDLHRRAIIDQPRAIQRRVVQQWLQRRGFDGDQTTNRIDAICGLAERNRSGAQLELGASWVVRLNQGVLSLRKESPGTIGG